MRVTVGKEASVEHENAADARALGAFAALGTLQTPTQDLEYDERREVKCDERGRRNGVAAPHGFDEIGALRRGIAVVFRFVRIAHAEILDEDLRHDVGARQVRVNL